MKKTKLITAIVLIAVMVIAMFAALVACKPNGDTGNGGTESGVPSGSTKPSKDPNSGNDPIQPGPPGDRPPDDDPVDPTPPPSMSPIDVFNKVIDSVEVPEQALN
ncbi:MAG: hypothetical protein K2I23_03590, partial [Clostridia bacterium]|nr:hypothetical protein [Clostridia bacterium]